MEHRLEFVLQSQVRRATAVFFEHNLKDMAAPQRDKIVVSWVFADLADADSGLTSCIEEPS